MSKTVGDYQIKEKIGKGSFAEVYLGVNIHDGKKFAVKVISKELINSEPKLAAGLESEIRIMHEFIHPHIVRLHRNFSSEKNVYLVLDYCQGGDLSKFIRKKGRLTEAVAVRFLHQLAEGLFFLKEKNFIHRDLKPANVLLTEFSENAIVKLADFGFARYLLEAALAQTRCGTPLYMAPEILESKDYDAKADIWSVGCIFYEMLAGTCPFKGQNEMDLLRNIRTKELRMPDDVVVSRPSLEIVSRLLEKDPARRPSIEMLLSLTTRLNAALPTIPAVPSTPTTPVPAAPAAEVRKESAERDEAEANTLRTALQSPAQQMSTPSSARSMRRLETTPSAPPIVEGGSARSTPRASEDRSSRDSHRGREAHTAEDDFIFIEYTARKGSFQSAVDQAVTVPAEEPVADHSDGPDVSEQEIMKNVAQRCSVFCELLNALTNVADRSIARDPCNLQFFRAKPDDDVSKLSCACPQEALKWCVRACSLYLHSLSLLQGFMSTLGNYADHLLESTTFQLFKKVPALYDVMNCPLTINTGFAGCV